MKKVVSLLFATALAATAIAQSEQSTEWQGKREAAKERYEQRKAEMKAELNLSDEQAEKWERIDEKYGMQRKAYREAHQAERDAYRAKMKASRDSQRADVDAILTPEQRTKLDAIRAERKAQHAEKRKDWKQKGKQHNRKK
jgi:protein CpxP